MWEVDLPRRKKQDVFNYCLCIVFKKSRSEFKGKQQTCKEFRSLAVPRKKILKETSLENLE